MSARMETIEDIRMLPTLAADSIHIWGVHVPAVLDRLDRLGGLLTEREMEKARRFRRESDRHSSIASRGALRALLAGYTGLAAEGIKFTYSDNGKPFIDGRDIAFNVSHSGEWVVLAIGCGRAIGVDIEKIKRSMDIRSVASRYFSAEEQIYVERCKDPSEAFFRIWVRKEAYIKACGSTLFSELKTASVPVTDGAELSGWYYYDLEAGSEYAAAVVTDGPMRSMPCYDFGGLKWES